MPSRTVLIVGANRGIGYNLAKSLSKRNWTVVGSVRPQMRDDSTVKELRAFASKVLYIDFLDEKSIIEAAKEYGSERPLDVLVNCGGVNVHPHPWLEHTAEDILYKFKVMTLGPFMTSKHFLPSLEIAPFGAIVNISSDAGSLTLNSGRFLGYRIAKAALNQQTRTLAKELQKAGKNIAVVSVHPGFVATRLTDFDFDDEMDTCINGITGIIDESLDMSKTGQFLDWSGAKIDF